MMRRGPGEELIGVLQGLVGGPGGPRAAEVPPPMVPRLGPSAEVAPP